MQKSLVRVPYISAQEPSVGAQYICNRAPCGCTIYSQKSPRCGSSTCSQKSRMYPPKSPMYSQKKDITSVECNERRTVVWGCRLSPPRAHLTCAVCCSVLQCAAVCCNVFQFVAVYRAGLELHSVLQCFAVCCSVLQSVAVCCSVSCWAAALCRSERGGEGPI